MSGELEPWRRLSPIGRTGGRRPKESDMIRTAGNTTRHVASRLARLLAVICVGGLAAGVSPALGAFPGENGKILFDSFRDDGETPDIWTMNPNGSNLVNLTANSGRASWRPDGQKIAFMSDRETPDNPTPPPPFPGPDFEIFVMNADGSNQTQITFNEFDDELPAWSPDGKKIIFQRDFDKVRGQADYDILTMKVNGTRERNLTNSPGVQDFDPDWSPNGRRIAFTSERDGDAEIYTMKPNGSRARQLTFNDAPFAFDGDPNWSPDSRKIAFTSERDSVPETPFQVEIYTMRANGDNQTRLTFDEDSDFLPAWSPDGRKIAFTSFRDATLETNPENAEIYTMRADGSHLANLTQNVAFDAAPDWQPLDDDDDDDD
jgi:Tol biopolymer transport system component